MPPPSKPLFFAYDTMFSFSVLAGFFLFSQLLSADARSKSFAKTCKVASSVGGKDAGPSILNAFKECGKGGKIVLDGYYSVDTVLLTAGENVEIELSGTVQYTPDITKWSNTSIFLTYQVSAPF